MIPSGPAEAEPCAHARVDAVGFDDLRNRTIAAAARDGYDPALFEIVDDRAGRAALLLLATLTSMNGTPNAAKTLAAIKTRSMAIAHAWGPPAVPIDAQHVTRDKRLDAIYQHARFPGRTKIRRGLRSAAPDELIRLADTAVSEKESLAEEVRRLTAELGAAKLANHVETVLEFAGRYGLVLSVATNDPAGAAEDENAGTFAPSLAARKKASDRAKATAGRKQTKRS